MLSTKELIDKHKKRDEYLKNYRKNNREKLNENSAKCMAKKRFTDFSQIKCRKVMRQNGYDLFDILQKTGFEDKRMLGNKQKKSLDELNNYDTNFETNSDLWVEKNGKLYIN